MNIFSLTPSSPMSTPDRDSRALGPRGMFVYRFAGRSILTGECESAEPCREETTKHPKDVARRNRQCEPRNKSQAGRRHRKKASRRHTETHMCASHVNDWAEDGKLSIGRMGAGASKGDGPEGLVDCPAKLQCTRPGGHYHRSGGRPFSGQQRRNEEAKGGRSHAMYVQCAAKSVIECKVPEHMHLFNVRDDVPRKGENDGLDEKHVDMPEGVNERPKPASVAVPQVPLAGPAIVKVATPVQSVVPTIPIAAPAALVDESRVRRRCCCRRRIDCPVVFNVEEPLYATRKVKVYLMHVRALTNLWLLWRWLESWIRFWFCLGERSEVVNVRTDKSDFFETYTFTDRDSRMSGVMSLVAGPFASFRVCSIYVEMLKELRKPEWRLLERMSVNVDGLVESTFMNATLRIASQLQNHEKWREHNSVIFFDTIAYFVQHSMITHNYLRQVVPTTTKPVFRTQGRALTLWSACALFVSTLWNAMSMSLMYIMTFLTLYLVVSFMQTLSIPVPRPADFGDLWYRPPWEGGPTEYQLALHTHSHCSGLHNGGGWSGGAVGTCSREVPLPSVVYATVEYLFR